MLPADPDLFNRWEAGQSLARDLILARAAGRPDEVGEERYADAMRRALDDQSAEPALKALLLALPSEGDLAVLSAPADPAALHAAREALRTRMALPGTGARTAGCRGRLLLAPGAERWPPGPAQCRPELLVADPHPLSRERARGHFDAAANMTIRSGPERLIRP